MLPYEYTRSAVVAERPRDVLCHWIFR